MQDEQEREPTKLSPVGEKRLRLNKVLTDALPSATREEIDHVQGQLQATPDEVVAAAVEKIRAAPDETLERVRAGEAALPTAGQKTASPL